MTHKLTVNVKITIFENLPQKKFMHVSCDKAIDPSFTCHLKELLSLKLSSVYTRLARIIPNLQTNNDAVSKF